VEQSRFSTSRARGQAVRGAFAATGSPAATQAVKPPSSARARGQPACRSSRATRALVASFGQVQ